MTPFKVTFAVRISNGNSEAKSKILIRGMMGVNVRSAPCVPDDFMFLKNGCWAFHKTGGLQKQRATLILCYE